MQYNIKNFQIPYKTFKREINDTNGRIFFMIFAAVTQISFCLPGRAICAVFIFQTWNHKP